jgi:hypothetical protein
MPVSIFVSVLQVLLRTGYRNITIASKHSFEHYPLQSSRRASYKPMEHGSGGDRKALSAGRTTQMSKLDLAKRGDRQRFGNRAPFRNEERQQP